MRHFLRTPLLELALGPTLFRATVSRGSRVQWQAEVPAVPLDELGPVLQALAADVPGGIPRRLRFRLEPPLVQHRALADLPAVSARELTRLVAHNAARYFRQNGHPLRTAGTWEDRPGGRPHLVAAEATTLGALLAAAEGIDRRVEDIVAAEPAPSTLSLLPLEERARRRQAWVRRWGRGVLGLALVLGSGGAVGLGWLAWEDRRLGRELARLEAPRAALARVRREAAGAEIMLAALIDAEAHRGDLGMRLAVLTQALPVEGRLDRLTLRRDGHGELEGQTPEVARLLDRLGAVGAVTLPRPAIREPGPAGLLDRYVATLRPRAP